MARFLMQDEAVSPALSRASRHNARCRQPGNALICGDAASKMEAAVHLARAGVDVYFPCDRFVGDVVGHDGRGVLIGSAPVDVDGGVAVIGNRPVEFRVDETVVVQSTPLSGRNQYYDAPARYFRRLAELAPVRFDVVEVDGPGQSGRVVERARELGAGYPPTPRPLVLAGVFCATVTVAVGWEFAEHLLDRWLGSRLQASQADTMLDLLLGMVGAAAIGVRVETAADAEPVRSWLAESESHRAVLFHSAPYPAGVALFDEFPERTTFGDPRPVFPSDDGL